MNTKYFVLKQKYGYNIIQKAIRLNEINVWF